jgi:hypothetical protein
VVFRGSRGDQDVGFGAVAFAIFLEYAEPEDVV